MKDAHGNVQQDGDTVTLVKVGTKAKYIRLIEGIGAMQLKSEFVKKV